MKKYPACIVLLLILWIPSKSQNTVLGLWEGKLNAGVSLRVVFHFTEDINKQVEATMDSPDQSVKGIKAALVIIKGDSLTIEIKEAAAVYVGKIINDSTITGSWVQGVKLFLNMKKVVAVSEVKRPQTPVPPFPYRSEDVVYFNKGKSIQYGATLTIPQGKEPFPAALLITGSGQQNRDEEIFGHKPFAVIADYLTRKGMVVLRVDDRGAGKTTGDVSTATSEDFAKDAIVGLEYLKSRSEVDKEKIGLIGHSEGGMIAQIVGAERKDIDFIILMAAPGEKITKLMEDQNRAVLTSTGVSKEYTNQYLKLYNEMLPAVINAANDSSAVQRLTKIVAEWVAATPKNIVATMTGIKDETSKQQFVTSTVKFLNTPWLKYFLSYDPEPYVRKLSSKVLALNGERDIQVVSKSNLSALEASLQKSKSKVYTVKELKGLNHLFQHCTTCTVNEYGVLEETIAPIGLETIADWLQKNVQNK